MKYRGALAYCFAVCISIACSAGDSAEGEDAAEQKPTAEMTDPAADLFPAFTLADLQGSPVSLEEMRGRVVLVVFFATWCPPCMAEVPVLNHLWETYREAGLEVVAIAVDPREGAEKVARFVEQHAVRYTVLLGTRETGRRYQVQGIPTTYLVGRDGQQLQRFIGYEKPEVVEQAVASALED
jgi:cytochrome c biogenesis protein CcmG/thiol:disulfide interchange protein DsbE